MCHPPIRNGAVRNFPTQAAVAFVYYTNKTIEYEIADLRSVAAAIFPETTIFAAKVGLRKVIIPRSRTFLGKFAKNGALAQNAASGFAILKR